MSLSQMEVFNKYVMPMVVETLQQQVQKFNGASNGAIQLTTEGFDGDFYQRSFYKSLAAARRRVDRYATNDAVSATNLQQGKQSTVKVAGGFGPVLFEPSQMTWLTKPTAEGIEAISADISALLLQDQLNTAIAALVAAIANQGADTTVDVSGSKVIDYVTVNNSHALFGDSSGNLVAEVMDGVSYHNFVGQNLTNTQQLFQYGNVRVIDVLGKAVVVTDAPALFSAAITSPSTPAKRRVLSLATSAAVVHDSRDIISNIETSNGKVRIETTFQMDYTFGLGLKGYTWDEANGGKSPTDVELATGSNWDKVAGSIKTTAGVLAVGRAA